MTEGDYLTRVSALLWASFVKSGLWINIDFDQDIDEEWNESSGDLKVSIRNDEKMMSRKNSRIFAFSVGDEMKKFKQKQWIYFRGKYFIV